VALRTTAGTRIEELSRRVVACRRCPRLVAWRERVAREKVRRFAAEEYWGKPLPGFGDPAARLVIVGLAPAAHGGNRTGRMFTGDESGNWLYRALHHAGFATSAASVQRDDGLVLRDCYITAAVRCAPPQNTPMRDEITRCAEFLHEELLLLDRVRVVVGLGRIGFDAAVRAYRAIGRIPPGKKHPFGHGAVTEAGGLTFIASYHPSQQNTFTGRLTRPMLDRVFLVARDAMKQARRGHAH
jgi:uracil-DNA glycosylase family 4